MEYESDLVAIQYMLIKIKRDKENNMIYVVTLHPHQETPINIVLQALAQTLFQKSHMFCTRDPLPPIVHGIRVLLFSNGAYIEFKSPVPTEQTNK